MSFRVCRMCPQFSLERISTDLLKSSREQQNQTTFLVSHTSYTGSISCVVAFVSIVLKQQRSKDICSNLINSCLRRIYFSRHACGTKALSIYQSQLSTKYRNYVLIMWSVWHISIVYAVCFVLVPLFITTTIWNSIVKEREKKIRRASTDIKKTQMSCCLVFISCARVCTCYFLLWRYNMIPAFWLLCADQANL